MKKRKIYGRAILLLPLALVLALQVNAKTIYSEYKLTGTTKEYKEDTELIKYTPVVMHKFYTLKRTNEVFMPHYYESEEAPYKDSYIYNRARTISNEKDPHAIIYKRVTFKYSDNQNNVINKIEVINNNPLEKPVDTHIYVYNDKSLMRDEKTKLSDKICTKLNYNIMIYAPRLVIEFDRDINLSLSIKYLHDTEVIYEQDLEPDDYLSSEKLVLEVKNESIYEKYMTDMGLLTLEDAQNSNYHKYYTNEILTYKFYNLEKEFYEDSRESYLDGYEYDEKDDYIVYDIYERTILEKTEDKENFQEPENSSTEKLEEDKPSKEDVIEKDPEPPAEQPEKPLSQPEKPVIRPEKPVESAKPEEAITESENSQKEPSKDVLEEETSKVPTTNETNQITPTFPKDEMEDSKLEMPSTPDKNQIVITEEKESEMKEPELPSNIKTDQESIKENSKVETVKDIVYVLENENNEHSETDLSEANEEKTKIEAELLVNEVAETNKKKSTTNTSLALKITLRIIISIIVLLIIRKIFCKVSANNAK